jgi:hypothetical protein
MFLMHKSLLVLLQFYIILVSTAWWPVCFWKTLGLHSMPLYQELSSLFSPHQDYKTSVLQIMPQCDTKPSASLSWWFWQAWYSSAIHRDFWWNWFLTFSKYIFYISQQLTMWLQVAQSFLRSQSRISHILQNQTFHYGVHKSPLLIHALSQRNLSIPSQPFTYLPI